MTRCLTLLTLLLGVLAVQAVRPGDQLTGVSDNANIGTGGPKAINPPAIHPAGDDTNKDADDALAVFSDLEAIFENDHSKNLETSFKQFGDSLKQIGDQIKAGIKKLSNDSRLPKVDLEKMKDWTLAQVKIAADKAQAQAIDVTKTANTAIDETAAKTKDTTKAVHDMATEGLSSMKEAATHMTATGVGKTEEDQLIEKLRALQANRAARYRSVRDQSSSDPEPQDELTGHLSEQLHDIKQSLDPERIQHAFDEMKKGIHALKSKFDAMANSIKDQVKIAADKAQAQAIDATKIANTAIDETATKTKDTTKAVHDMATEAVSNMKEATHKMLEQSKVGDKTTGRTRREVNLVAENVTSIIKNAFATKDMDQALEGLGKSFVDIIHQMKSNIDNLDKEVKNTMAKHRKTTGNKRAVPLPKRSSETSTGSNKESDDLEALRNALEEFKSTVNTDKIKAKFAKFEDTMKQMELEIKDEFEKFQTLIVEATKDSSSDVAVAERGLREAPVNSKAVGNKEIADKLEKLYTDITPEAVRNSFNDILDDLKSLGKDIDAGFDAVTQKDTDGLSETQRTFLHKIKRAIANAKDNGDAQPWRRQGQDGTNEGNTLECLNDMLHDMQTSVNMTDLNLEFPQISKDIQRLNMELEHVLAKMKNALKESGEKDILRRTNTQEGDMLDQLEGAFDAKKINKKFSEFSTLIENAMKKLKTDMAKACKDVEEKMKEQAVKRSSVPNDTKDIEVDPEVIKVVAEIKDTFDPENIKKAFKSLHGEIMKVGDKLEKGVKNFEQSVESARKKAHPVVRQVPAEPKEHPSADSGVPQAETVLTGIKPEDVQQAIQNAVNKLKELRNILKSGADKIETDLQKDVTETFDKIMVLLHNGSQRTRRDTKEGEGNEGLEGITPEKFMTAFRWLNDNVEKIKQEFIEQLDKLTKQEAHGQEKRNTNVDTSITEEIKQAFDKDKITKAFEEVLDAFKTANEKLNKGIKKATHDVSRLSGHLNHVKRILNSDKHNNGAEEIYNGIMKALTKIRSTFSREALAKYFQKLDAEVNTVETEANEAIKKMESWILSKADQADQQHGPQATKADAMRRGLSGSTNNDGNSFDPKAMDIDIDKAVDALSPEKLEKLNSLVEHALGEAQKVASSLKVFGEQLKQAVPPVPTLPPLSPMKPVKPMTPIKPMTPKSP